MNLNEEIKRFLEPEAIDYLGFADLTQHKEAVFSTGGNIVKGYPYGISLGIAIPDSIVDLLPEALDPNVACQYKTHGYQVLNQRLDLASSKLASFLNQKGHRTLPIAAAERTNEVEATPTVSHKTIAHIAGLGWIGKNCLLITPDHGPRVRFTSLLTNAPLQAIVNPLPQRCYSCTECVKICPVKAIKGNPFEECENREARLDFKKCQDHYQGLKKSMKWEACGLCLYICPEKLRKLPDSQKRRNVGV